MIIKDFLPDPGLSEFVQCYRIVHFEFDGPGGIPAKIYPPKPENCLHFFLDGNIFVRSHGEEEQAFYRPVLAGQYTSVFKRRHTRRLINFQIVFQPHALFRLTGIPSYELINRHTDASDLLPGWIGIVNEKLYEAKTHTDKLFLANQFVKDLIAHERKGHQPIDTTIHQMMLIKEDVGLSKMADCACLCTKQFERNFRERTGINPKMYGRIIRFNRAFNIKNAYPSLNWMTIAFECGYHDYQHLVKDYTHFTGASPKEFHIIENNSPECTLGLANDLYKSRAPSIYHAA